MMYVSDKKWATMSRTQELMSKNLSYRDNFNLTMLRYSIEKKMAEEQNKEDKRLAIVVKYESMTTQFDHKVYIMAKLKKRFWNNIYSAQPSFSILSRVSGKMSILKVKIKDLYQRLSKIREKNVRTMEKYGAYLNELESNNRESSKIYEQLLYSVGEKKKKKSMPQDKFKNAGIVVITGRYRERGKIININDEAVKMFGYRQNELINTPIENYMPEFFALKHKSDIRKFYKSGVSKKMGKKSIVHILNKENFLSSCHLHLKMMSSLENGINILGIMT